MKTLTKPASEKYRSILIFGPPGAGKGTLGRFLSLAGNHIHLSSGDIFRGLSHDSPTGKIYHSYATKGQLLPDHVMLDIWHRYVEGLIATNLYFPHKQLLLLDGIPRTLLQAELLEKSIDLLQVILLETPNTQQLVDRMLKRRSLEGRVDDAEESVLRDRIKVYENTTRAVLNYYPASLISHINAAQTPLEVLRDVLIKLTPLL